MNKKEIFKKLNGKMVKREYINIKTIEDIDNMRNEIIKLIESNGDNINILKENENCFEFEGFSNFILKPKCKNGIGMFEVRSKDYIFTNTENNKYYGEIPKTENIEILDNGFIIIFEKLKNDEVKGIKYTLIE